MSLSFPIINSSDTRLSSYCNFIEYNCFVNGEISFDELDINDYTSTLTNIIDELKRRLDLYDTFIPYEIKKNKIISKLPNKEQYLYYFYCLYYSLKGGNSDSKITNIFEKISDLSLKNYFGTKSSIITSIGQHSGLLINKIDSITSKLFETIGNKEDIPPKAKDGSIDIITFKPIDKRGNQLICLTDATIGKSWKDDKVVNIQLNKWKKIIHFKCEPTTCLSIVHVISREDFNTASDNNGLIFDRTRVVKYYYKSEFVDSVFDEVELDLNVWINNLQ
jgi:hypothetical protein